MDWLINWSIDDQNWTDAEPPCHSTVTRTWDHCMYVIHLLDTLCHVDLSRNSRNSCSAVAARMHSTAHGNARTMHGKPTSILLSEIFRCLCHSANVLHPWRLTWNIIMEVWKIMFLSKWVICRFHVNLPGCTWFSLDLPFHLPFSGIFAVSPMKNQQKLRFSFPGWQKRRRPLLRLTLV